MLISKRACPDYCYHVFAIIPRMPVVGIQEVSINADSHTRMFVQRCHLRLIGQRVVGKINNETQIEANLSP